MSHFEEIDVKFADSPSLDAFGRLRVSELTTLLDLKQLHDSQPLLVDIVTGGTGADAHSTTNAATTLSTAAASDYAIAQTLQSFNYQSAKSHLVFMTFSDFQVETNIEKRIGYFNSSIVAPYTADYDGIFLENDGTDIRLRVYRTGTSTTNVAQSAFNLDVLDGTGDSGITIDWEKANILCFDFEWLGVGRLRVGVVVDGMIVYFHEVLNANNTDNVYMSSPNHPLRWEIRQTGVGSGSMDYICASVNSEGAINQLGKVLSDNQGTTNTSANSTANTYALMGVRQKTTHLDAIIDLLEFTVLSASNDNQLWKLILNPTVGGTFTYADVTNGAVQTAKASGAGNTITGGTLLDSGYLNQQSSIRSAIDSAIRLGSQVDGTRDEIVLCVQPLTSNTDVYGSITWRENV